MQLHVTWFIGWAGLDDSPCESTGHQRGLRNRVYRCQSPSVSPVQRDWEKAGPGAEAKPPQVPGNKSSKGRAEMMGHSEIHKRRWGLPCCLDKGTPELPACCTPTDTICRVNSCHSGTRPDSPWALCVSGPTPSFTARHPQGTQPTLNSKSTPGGGQQGTLSPRSRCMGGPGPRLIFLLPVFVLLNFSPPSRPLPQLNPAI